MQNEIYLPEVSVQERRSILEAHAVKVETTKYQKQLTPDELDARREIHTDNSIKLSELDDELTAVKRGFKERMDPLRMQNKLLLTEIKTRQQTVDGVLYQLPNFDSGFMETFNEEGELIGTRKLRPDEKQGNIFSLKKAQ